MEDFQYDRQLHDFYDAFRRAGVNVDVAFPPSDLSAYRIVVAPALYVTDQALVDKLTAFVKNGGTLILTFRSGVKDEHNVVTDRTLPGPFADIAGVAIHEFDPQINEEQEIVGPGRIALPHPLLVRHSRSLHGQSPGDLWQGLLRRQTGRHGEQAGKGRVYYVGTESKSPLFYDRLIALAAKKSLVALNARIPPGVEVAVRQKAGRKIIFVMNYTGTAQTVPLDQAYQNALTGKTEPMDVQIPAYEVKVLTEE